MGWLGPSILTATEGWPFLQMGTCLWSRSIDCLCGDSQLMSNCEWLVKNGRRLMLREHLHSAQSDDFLDIRYRIRLNGSYWREQFQVSLCDIHTNDDRIFLVEDGNG